MSPILGVIASANFRVPTSYESIATTTVGSGGTATITFSSIPATYKHLQIRTLIRSAGSDASYQHLSIQLNGDTSNLYWGHGLYGTGSTVAVHTDGSLTSKILGYNIPTSTQTASAFGGGVVDILDYESTSKYKVIRALGGFDSNGGGALGLYSGNYNSTSAITSIELKVYQGSNFAEYSHFALYGIKS